MAPLRSLFSHEVADLCLGKPPLKSLSIAATVGEALSALKRLGETYLSVWSCNHAEKNDVVTEDECRCVGKVCMLDVISYLGKEDNLSSPSKALQAPIEVLIPKAPSTCLVRHLEPNARLVSLFLDSISFLFIHILEFQMLEQESRKSVKFQAWNQRLHL